MLPYNPLSEEGYERLGRYVAEDKIGEEFAVACTASKHDHVHAVRIGPEGAGLEGRVAIKMHDLEDVLVVYLDAPSARSLAAHLLTSADELDGYVPLTFHHPDEG